MWVEPYCLLIKIFQKDYFLLYSDFNSWVTNNFLRQYGWCVDKTVQVAQMDNMLQPDNTGWNITQIERSTCWYGTQKLLKTLIFIFITPSRTSYFPSYKAWKNNYDMQLLILFLNISFILIFCPAILIKMKVSI